MAFDAEAAHNENQSNSNLATSPASSLSLSTTTLDEWLQFHKLSVWKKVLSDYLSVDKLSDVRYLCDSDVQEFLSELKNDNHDILKSKSIKDKIYFKRKFGQLIQDYKRVVKFDKKTQNNVAVTKNSIDNRVVPPMITKGQECLRDCEWILEEEIKNMESIKRENYNQHKNRLFIWNQKLKQIMKQVYDKDMNNVKEVKNECLTLKHELNKLLQDGINDSISLDLNAVESKIKQFETMKSKHKFNINNSNNNNINDNDDVTVNSDNNKNNNGGVTMTVNTDDSFAFLDDLWVNFETIVETFESKQTTAQFKHVDSKNSDELKEAKSNVVSESNEVKESKELKIEKIGGAKKDEVETTSTAPVSFEEEFQAARNALSATMCGDVEADYTHKHISDLLKHASCMLQLIHKWSDHWLNLESICFFHEFAEPEFGSMVLFSIMLNLRAIECKHPQLAKYVWGLANIGMGGVGDSVGQALVNCLETLGIFWFEMPIKEVDELAIRPSKNICKNQVSDLTGQMVNNYSILIDIIGAQLCGSPADEMDCTMIDVFLESVTRLTKVTNIDQECDYYRLLIGTINLYAQINGGTIEQEVIECAQKNVGYAIRYSFFMHCIKNDDWGTLRLVWEESIFDAKISSNIMKKIAIEDKDGNFTGFNDKSVEWKINQVTSDYYTLLERGILNIKLIYWGALLQSTLNKMQCETNFNDGKILFTRLTNIVKNTHEILMNISLNSNEDLKKRAKQFKCLESNFVLLYKWWNVIDNVIHGINLNKNMIELKSMTMNQIVKMEWECLSDAKEVESNKIFEIISQLNHDNDDKTVIQWQQEKATLVQSRKEFMKMIVDKCKEYLLDFLDKEVPDV